MNLSKREFLQVWAPPPWPAWAWAAGPRPTPRPRPTRLYDLPRFGNVSLLHMTDCHAQLQPIHFREPSVNLGVGDMHGQLPHLVGEHLLKAAKRAGRHAPRPMRSPTWTSSTAARRYGKVGGFAHLATLVKRLKASRPGALLLDGGDTWQGSATALWTKGQDMVDAAKLLGVDVMTGHWEFTLGMERVQGDRREGLRRQGRLRRAERQDHRLRRPGVQALRACARSTACPAPSSARPSPTRRSPTRATWWPTGPSASRTRTCRRWSTRRAARARRSSCSSATTAWTWT